MNMDIPYEKMPISESKPWNLRKRIDSIDNFCLPADRFIGSIHRWSSTGSRSTRTSSALFYIFALLGSMSLPGNRWEGMSIPSRCLWLHLGLIALAYSLKSSAKADVKFHNKALLYSRRALLWNLVSLVFAVLSFIMVSFPGAVAELGSLQSFSLVDRSSLSATTSISLWRPTLIVWTTIFLADRTTVITETRSTTWSNHWPTTRSPRCMKSNSTLFSCRYCKLAHVRRCFEGYDMEDAKTEKEWYWCWSVARVWRCSFSYPNKKLYSFIYLSTYLYIPRTPTFSRFEIQLEQ